MCKGKLHEQLSPQYFVPSSPTPLSNLFHFKKLKILLKHFVKHVKCITNAIILDICLKLSKYTYILQVRFVETKDDPIKVSLKILKYYLRIIPKTIFIFIFS